MVEMQSRLSEHGINIYMLLVVTHIIGRYLFNFISYVDNITKYAILNGNIPYDNN